MTLLVLHRCLHHLSSLVLLDNAQTCAPLGNADNSSSVHASNIRLSPFSGLAQCHHVTNNAVNTDAAVTPDEPIWPVHDDTLITSTLDSMTPFPDISKPIILSTVLNEAGHTIYSQFTDLMNTCFYKAPVQALVQEPEARNLLKSPYY
jgi:hypothetical protein